MRRRHRRGQGRRGRARHDDSRACAPPPVGYLPNCIASAVRWTRSRTRDRVRAMIAGNRPDAPTVAGRDRVTLVTYVVLLLVTAAAWIQILSSAMQADDMAGMSMPLAPTLAEGALYVAAWTVMMAAMMLPSAAPMIGLYAATQRNAGGALARLGRVTLFTLTYLS